MPVTNPWLAGPSPEKRLDRERLSERILNLLSCQNMCVLATTGPGGPLATPVRYYHLDFTVMFTAAPRSPKMRNIAADPRVSVGIFAPLVGQASSRGAQVFGRARVLSPGEASHEEHWEAFRWQSDHVERSLSLDEPPGGPLVVVAAERIVYTEHWLRRDGYAPRQFWRADRVGDDAGT
ncbi:pyridoxamine 5'-phosphate oxidase family protein [Umezawaea endophytica]|uniref:Pyridoxamine 5'-phosphate oxidase family protein n=1 Tax=Umezawaea endophytica TaxID=1654476 RepID=A0A9X2VN70_9PSEU|nr:pyridoxamine 5'-phosphate oxidase family protein [Umezawaea endophytica]MCS7479600.1 pyridoxamine 5'-phosphate oxidase family protein [Umezawaea endophytica]